MCQKWLNDSWYPDRGYQIQVLFPVLGSIAHMDVLKLLSNNPKETPADLQAIQIFFAEKIRLRTLWEPLTTVLS